MIQKIKFENFRCYKKTELLFKNITVIVGKNNAGKSTIIEALRLIAMAGKKSKQAIYTQPPISKIQIPANEFGFKIDVQKLKIDLRGVVYFYNNSNAKIVAEFDNKASIIIYLNREIAFACLHDENDNVIKYKSKAQKYDFDSLDILPQIGLIKENEKKLSKETIYSDKDTYLSSRHFRNELLEYKQDYYKDFKSLAEETWHGLRIMDLSYKPSESDFINLFVEDASFTAEIGLMGSGLQMWLQIIWFIGRTRGKDTIILDEPDVYMHPDLQRKVLRLVKSRYPQIIIATHSIEIISEVEPKNIVTVNKKNRQMVYANNSEAVQNIIDEIGGVENISLLRIGNAKKCLFVEGKDLKILSLFHNKLYPKSEYSLCELPCIPLGGFTRLNEAFGASKLFYKETLGNIKCYCIVDSDYYPQSELCAKQRLADDSHLILHIWDKKEIENYVLNPNTIFRLVEDKISYQQFIDKFEKLIETFRDDVFDSYSQQINNANSSLGGSASNKMARKFITENWTTLDNKLRLVCGKKAVKKVNQWLKSDYNVHCSITEILNNMLPKEVDPEIVTVIDALINN